jgi:glucuronate isomerase
MKKYLNEDFLLETKAARRLYHGYAASMPILDYHCHLPPAEVAQDARYKDMAQVWLGGDHYKWRAMRANGVPEPLVTGPGKGYESFLAWARTLDAAIGNPLHHWAHLELKRYFGIDQVLNEKTAPAIWESCNASLGQPGFSTRGLLSKMRVAAICTTDDPADALEQHLAYAGRPGKKDGDCVLLPSFRPDKAISLADPAAWKAYLARLGAAAGVEIRDLESLGAALKARHDFFHSCGCRISDNAIVLTPARPASPEAAKAAFGKAFSGEAPCHAEAEAFRSFMLVRLAEMDFDAGWSMQLHMGAIRNLNSRALAAIGPDTGYDAIGDAGGARDLGYFLDALDSRGKLPRTILYSLNPDMNESLASVMGCFQDGSVPGKMQLGSAWWFNDHIDGMDRQLSDLADIGLLPRFVGMLTDSRSFLSFPRHEYFRRILCRKLGAWVERGLAPADYGLLGSMVKDISFRNAAGYFRLPGVDA